MKNLFKRVLAIETSCDDTSVAIVEEKGWVRAVLTANQDLQHEDFGGVVPEIAGRNHSLKLLPLIDKLLKKTELEWSDIDGIAVTNRPGLVGSLIVGLVTAKSLSQALQIPYVAVNHLEAHLLAPFLRDENYAPPETFDYPYIGLAISGGHTHLYHVTGLGCYRVLGKTLDDAAGEAFDKFAKMLGLGFPGGVKVDQRAKQGDIKAYDFPRPLIRELGYEFSFSGLKSSAERLLHSMSDEEKRLRANDLCASFQEAIVDVLIAKLERAVFDFQLKKAVLTGGVSANSRLRERSLEWAQSNGVELVIPPLRYCTDNAAMVGWVGLQLLQNGKVSSLKEPPSPQVYPEDFIYE